MIDARKIWRAGVMQRVRGPSKVDEAMSTGIRATKRQKSRATISCFQLAFTLLLISSLTNATLSSRDDVLPLLVTNNCKEDMWPAIMTQFGTGPSTTGFKLSPGDTNTLSVSADWQGRVWGRTNCTFDSASNDNSHSGQDGAPCTTGDCGNFLECQGAGQPATLAEFNYAGYQNSSFYDISLVDGYNLPIGIKALTDGSNDPRLMDIPPNLLNPVCIGSASLLTAPGDTSDEDFGTNSSYPLPLEQSISVSDVADWCPFPLLILPPQKPGDGVYPYPDDNIQRPLFSPCLSACSKWNKPQYCCTGSHNDPNKCQPSYYSTQAKKVCPDAYTFAYDDATSTFAVPQGVGFEVVLCPAGRSTNILATFGAQIQALKGNNNAANGIQQLARNRTWIQEHNNEGSPSLGQDLVSGKSFFALAIVMVWMCF